jgi:hypothetical protein
LDFLGAAGGDPAAAFLLTGDGVTIASATAVGLLSFPFADLALAGAVLTPFLAAALGLGGEGGRGGARRWSGRVARMLASSLMNNALCALQRRHDVSGASAAEALSEILRGYTFESPLESHYTTILTCFPRNSHWENIRQTIIHISALLTK